MQQNKVITPAHKKMQKTDIQEIRLFAVVVFAYVLKTRYYKTQFFNKCFGKKFPARTSV